MDRTRIDDRGAILVEEKSPLRASHVLIEFSVERHRFGLDTCYGMDLELKYTTVYVLNFFSQDLQKW